MEDTSPSVRRAPTAGQQVGAATTGGIRAVHLQGRARSGRQQRTERLHRRTQEAPWTTPPWCHGSPRSRTRRSSSTVNPQPWPPNAPRCSTTSEATTPSASTPSQGAEGLTRETFGAHSHRFRHRRFRPCGQRSARPGGSCASVTRTTRAIRAEERTLVSAGSSWVTPVHQRRNDHDGQVIGRT